jgi:hypothetical protein
VRGSVCLILLGLIASGCANAKLTPDDLWEGRAHLEQVGELKWEPPAVGRFREQAGWFAVRNGTWYAFNRAQITQPVSYCPTDHADVVVRESKDRGKTWSGPTSAVALGASPAGDACAVLDGTTFYDETVRTWHMLAQCLDRDNVGSWSLCHYTREAESPMGRFVADAGNPVVRAGQLWSRICSGHRKACDPAKVVDEGTPDIVEKRGDLFYVTIHGFNPVTKTGYRGVVASPDFHRWMVSGNGLPGDATLGPLDCPGWVRDCIGVGQATTLLGRRHNFMVIETMNKSLGCEPGQEWVFELLRAGKSHWPRSGKGGWERLPGRSLLTPSWPDPKTPCQVQYARWLEDGSDVYLVYEDWGPAFTFVERRLLKLTPGGGTTKLHTPPADAGSTPGLAAAIN